MNRYSAILTGLVFMIAASGALAVRDSDQPVPQGRPVVQAPAKSVAADQREVAAQAGRLGWKVEWDERHGTPQSIRGQDLGARRAFSGGKGLAVRGRSRPEDSIAVLDNLSRFYGWTDVSREFKAGRTEGDRLGFQHVRVTQVHGGLRVVGGDLIVHFDRRNQAYQVNGRYVGGVDVPVVAQIAANSAVAVAQKDLTTFSPGGAGLVAPPVLVVYAAGVSPQLAYEFVLAQPAKVARWRYWVNALTGELIHRYNEIENISAPTSNGAHTNVTGNVLTGEGGGAVTVAGWFENANALYYLHNTNEHWQVYNVATIGWPDSSTFAYRSNAVWGASDRAEMSLAANFDSIQRYWLDRHSRSSYDGAGIMARADVHEGINYVNAYYDGIGFHFGDGDNVNATSLAVLDVAAHEFTHGVTDYSAGLQYWSEPGALNESFSDIFGACTEFYGQPDGQASYPGRVAGAADWLMAEDCWLVATALRDMRNPRNMATVGPAGAQPSRYKGSYWYSGSGDNAGVHQNSGVQNFFFYLLSEGGSGDNDGVAYNVTGINVTNAEQVAYRALTVYCTPGTDYRGVRLAWLSAAEDLNPDWVSSVSAAWSACDVGALTVTLVSGLAFRGAEGGPFTPGVISGSLANSDPASISWASSVSQPWLTVAPGSGTLPAQGATELSFSVNSAAATLVEGTYTATLAISNAADGGVVTRPVTLLIGAPDYFTELFSSGDNDLDHSSVTFTPNESGSFYEACRAAAASFPSDPAGGTALTLGDDSYAAVTLTGGMQVALYGTNSSTFFVGANGTITFGTGDTAFAESLPGHFSLPRIAALFDDLNPAAGQVTWKQWSDRVAVTWQGVPEYGMANANSFQIELFFDGRLRLTWLDLAATDGLAGLSRGAGVPLDFVESDFTSYNMCVPPDDLQVLTVGNLIGAGLQGGPFEPAGKTYALTNSGGSALDWAAVPAAAWLAATPASGTLAAGQGTNVVVGFDAAALSLLPGTYNGSLVFSNAGSGVAFTRLAQLTVQVHPGRIDVLDSIAPTDDRTMDFGDVIAGLSRTESITITNQDLTWALTVSNLIVHGVTTFAPVHIPAFTGVVAHCNEPVSMGRAPVGARSVSITAQPIAAPSTVPCYGINFESGQPPLVSFSSATPGTLTTIGTVTGALYAAAFLNGDFSKLYVLNNDTAQLQTIDTVTATQTDIGPCLPPEGHMWVGLTADPNSRVLYAASTAGTVSMLHRVDPLTGAATTVGTITGAPCIITIAINADGQMYGVDIAYDNLLSIDPATGAGTVVGSLGVNANYVQGMDFDQDNNILYWAAYTAEDGGGALRVIDTTTGASALVGAFPGNSEVVMAVASGHRGLPFKLLNAPALPLTVPPGQSVTLQMQFAPTLAEPYNAAVVIQHNDFTETAVNVNLSGVGTPDYLRISPAGTLSAIGYTGGPFTPESMTYALSNAGPVSIEWSAGVTQDWFAVSSSNGTLDAGAVTNIVVSFSAAANALGAGSYAGAVTFTNLTTGVGGQSRAVALNLFACPRMAVTPASFTVTNEYGVATNTVLNVENQSAGAGGLSFQITGCETNGWLTVSPNAATNVEPGASINCTVSFLPGNLEAGTYTGQLAIAGNDNVLPLVTVPVAMTVLPDGLTISPSGSFTSSGSPGGPFSPSFMVYTVSNRTESVLNWTLTPTSSWLSVSATNGTLTAGAVQVVTASVNSAANIMPYGQYSDRLTFSNLTTGAVQFRTAQLTVTSLLQTFYALTLDTDPGWSLEGQWQFGKPQGLGGDPSSGHTGTNVFGYNLAGKYPNSIPAYYLTSTAFDCTVFKNVTLSFWRWLGLDAGDGATVEVSHDGLNWTLAWSADVANFADIAWQQMQLDISAVADGQRTVYVRWCMGPTMFPVYTYSGWNIDDITLMGNPTDALRVQPLSGLTAQGYFGGPFTPANTSYVITNLGSIAVNWTATSTQSWVSVTPGNGTLAGGQTATVTVAVNSDATTLPVGMHADTVTFSNLVTGLAQTRPVQLTIDPIPGPGETNQWQVLPLSGLTAEGYFGGPFTLANASYVITNLGISALNWTATSPQSWVSVTPGSGTLAGGRTTTVTVAVNSGANTLPVGTHTGMVAFSNVLTGVAQTRPVQLTIDAVGKIAVFDSVSPATDLKVPFGEVLAGFSRTETVTITNSDATQPLIISGLGLNYATNSFGPALLLSWETHPVVASTWNQSGITQTGAVARWQGAGPYADSLAVLVYADDFFHPAPATFVDQALQALGFSYTAYYNGDFAGFEAALTSRKWDLVIFANESSFLPSTPLDKLLTYVQDGGRLVAYTWEAVNGHALWSALGVKISTSYVGDPPPPVYWWVPTHQLFTLPEDVPPFTSLQSDRYDYCGQYVEPIGDAIAVAGYTTGPSSNKAALVVANNGRTVFRGFSDGQNDADLDQDGKFDGAELWVNLIAIEKFTLNGVPALPYSLPPGAALTIDATYHPTGVGSNVAVLAIDSNDADEPHIAVELSGAGTPDYLRVSPATDFAAEGRFGGPFTPSTSLYALSNAGPIAVSWAAIHTQSWVSVTPDAGTLASGATTNVAVAFTAGANSLPVGTYLDQITFSNLTTTLVSGQRQVQLTVFTSPIILVAPLSITVTNPVHGSTKRLLTVGNAAGADANLNVRLNAYETGHALNPFTAAAAAAAGLRPPAGHNFTQVQPGVTFMPNRLLVRFVPETVGAQRAAALQAAGGGAIAYEYRLVPGLCIVQLPAGTTVEAALQTFNGQAGVLYAEPDYERHTSSTNPNDPRFGEQWGLDNTGQNGGTPGADIDAPAAWDSQTGNPNILVAVIDSGVDYNHEDLAANIWSNPGEIPGNGIDDDGNGFIDDVHGYNFVNNTGDPMDDFNPVYHGTHCAGILGAVGNNGIGVAGVCWKARIMALKFLDASGSGNTSDAIRAIEYATLMGARLTSNSWGGDGYDQSLKDAIDVAGAANSAFIAAAGNDGRNTDVAPNYPSCYTSSNLIAVAASGFYDELVYFSNYGLTTTDLAAPGYGILSCMQGNRYQFMDGTSMATPHVAGAYALLLSANPSLSVAQAKAALMDTVAPVLPGKCVSGGRLNVAAALAKVGTRVPWLTVDPEFAYDIAPGHEIKVTASFQAGDLEDGSYTGSIVVAGNDYLSPVVTVPTLMVVLPDDLRIRPRTGFAASRMLSGNTISPSLQQYTVTNGGASAVTWTASHSNAWLKVSPTNGVLPAGGSVVVTALLGADALAFPVGMYADVLVFRNENSGFVQSSPVTFNVYVDLFTEWFDAETNDLAWSSLTFTPDGSTNFYSVCRAPATVFPTDPTNSTKTVPRVNMATYFTLTGGALMSLYGSSASRVMIGANGYIIVGFASRPGSDESLTNHFSLPRVSGLLHKLDPLAGGTVSYKQLTDRFAVTWLNVPEYGTTATNSFQIEMFFNGRIRVTWLNIGITNGLVGLSRGDGVPAHFGESDLSSYMTASQQAWQQCYGVTADSADADGDGFSNSNEFLTGFNPTNPAAYLHILGLAMTGDDLSIRCLGANGDTNYAGGPASLTNVLEFTTKLPNGSSTNAFTSAGVTNVLSGGTGSGVITNMVDVGGGINVSSRFYRVRVLSP